MRNFIINHNNREITKYSFSSAIFAVKKIVKEKAKTEQTTYRFLNVSYLEDGKKVLNADLIWCGDNGKFLEFEVKRS